MELGLKNKVVVITGASKGIGRVAAVALAKEGASVVAAARTVRGRDSVEETVNEIRQAGGSAIAVKCDVAVASDVESMVNITLSAFGRVDVMINNAGVDHRKPILETAPGEWDRIIAINVNGVFYCCKYVLPTMIEQGGGNIITVSSAEAVRYAPDNLGYNTSKAAADRFTLNLAEDMRKYNIAANSYWPGFVLSDMTAGRIGLIGNLPEPTETVLPSLLWLARQDASVVTGQILYQRDFGKTWGPGIDMSVAYKESLKEGSKPFVIWYARRMSLWTWG